MNAAKVWLFVLVLLGGSTLAQAEGLWSADLGWGPVLATGRWAPLRLSLPTAALVEVVTLRRDQERVSARFDHPAGAWEHPVFLLEGTQSLRVRFQTPQETREVSLPVAAKQFPGHLVVVSGLDAAAIQAVEAVLLPQEPVRTTELSPAQWPQSPLGWLAISAVVVRDPGAVLSPVQVQAVRAWMAAGGRLVVVDPQGASLAAQVGSPAVTVQKPSPQDWKPLLDLVQYGTRPLLGSEFGATPPSARLADRPDGPWAVALVVGWAFLGGLLALRKKETLGPGLALAAGGTLAVAALAGTGVLTWDQGLVTHGREVVLPGGLGRFATQETVQAEGPRGTLYWPESSPWALQWEQLRDAAPFLLREANVQHVVRDAFLPPRDRTSKVQVTWVGQRLRWSSEPSRDLDPDLPWITQMARSRPETLWQVGLDGSTCWLKPEARP